MCVLGPPTCTCRGVGMHVSMYRFLCFATGRARRWRGQATWRTVALPFSGGRRVKESSIIHQSIKVSEEGHSTMTPCPFHYSRPSAGHRLYGAAMEGALCTCSGEVTRLPVSVSSGRPSDYYPLMKCNLSRDLLWNSAATKAAQVGSCRNIATT